MQSQPRRGDSQGTCRLISIQQSEKESFITNQKDVSHCIQLHSLEVI